MELVLLPVLVAFLVQFGTLPLLVGGRTLGEAVGWPMIMAIFFGIPSIVVYSIMFGGFHLMSPPPTIAVVLGVAIPAALVLGFEIYRGMPVELGRKNWVLWMGMIGGLAGSVTYLHLRSDVLFAI